MTVRTGRALAWVLPPAFARALARSLDLRSWRGVACAALFMILQCAAAQGETIVTFPGTDWSIVLPEGFARVDTSPSEYRNAADARLVALQMPRGPLPEDDSAAVGQTRTVDGLTATIERFDNLTRPEAPGVGIVAWLVDERSRMISVQLMGARSNLMVFLLVPETAEATTPLEPIYLAMQAAQEVPEAAAEDPLASLPFTLPEMGGLRLSQVVPGTAAILTDGPESDMTLSSTQRFVVVVAQAGATRQDLDAKNSAWPLAYKLQDEVPGTEILDARAVDGPTGPQIFVRYRRPHDLGGTVLGVMMMRIEADHALMMTAQVAEGDSAGITLAQTIFDSVRLR